MTGALHFRDTAQVCADGLRQEEPAQDAPVVLAKETGVSGHSSRGVVWLVGSHPDAQRCLTPHVACLYRGRHSEGEA